MQFPKLKGCEKCSTSSHFSFCNRESSVSAQLLTTAVSQHNILTHVKTQITARMRTSREFPDLFNKTPLIHHSAKSVFHRWEKYVALKLLAEHTLRNSLPALITIGSCSFSRNSFLHGPGVPR